MDFFCFSDGNVQRPPPLPRSIRARAAALGIAIEIDHYGPSGAASIPTKKLLYRFDVLKKGETGDACLLLYETTDGFSLVATVADGGDAEVFLTKDEFARFQQRILEVDIRD